MINKKLLVLSVSDQSENSLAKYSYLHFGVNYDIESNLVKPLHHIFSHVTTIDFLQYHVRFGPKKTNQYLRETIIKEKPDYLIWISYMYEIGISDFDFARDHGVKTIGWFFDDEFRFDNYSVMWTSCLDYVFTNDPKCIKKYEKCGVKPYFTLIIPSEKIYYKLDMEKRLDVSFIGSNIADRNEYIEYLKKSDIDIFVSGKGWEGGYIETSDVVKTYNCSKINLCFTKSVGLDSRHQFKGKIFEIMMSGGFIMIEYFEGLEKLFTDGEEAVFFQGKKDLVNKIEYYLISDVERENIAYNGWMKVKKNYSMEGQLSNIFSQIIEGTITEKKADLNCEPFKTKIKNAYILASRYHHKFGNAHLREKHFCLAVDEYSTSLQYNQNNISSYILLQISKLCNKLSLLMS